ncbi:MAG: rRNA maturation RNase YbeY [Patescibacteria group bacterium]
MISIELNQSRLKGGMCLPKTILDRTCKHVAKYLSLKQPRRISVAFVSEKEMRKWNLHYRGIDRVTDVLSFTFDEQDVYGEILLSYEQAKRQAKMLKHSVREELVFLLVHGLLHVFGYDHVRPTDAKKMFPLQTKILTSLDVDPHI